MRLTRLFRAMHTVIIGPPGSGKGTISARMCRDFDMHHLSSGDLLRASMADDKGQLAQEAKKYVEAGELVPDKVMVPLILEELRKIPLYRNWVLDGFPRSPFQAQSLYRSENIDSVINLDVPFETIMKRLGGRWTHLASGRVYNVDFNPPQRLGFDDITQEPLIQREDDKPETIKRRQQSYEEQTKPVLQFFEEKGILKSFSGTETDVIYPSIVEHLKIIRSKEDAQN